jgi:uncharacterized integral membrane protein
VASREAFLSQQPVEPKRPFYENPKVILGSLLILVFIVFVAVNAEEVTVDFVVTDVDIALAWALLITGLIGFLIGVLLGRTRLRSRS